MHSHRYVVLTAARNEEQYIEATIRSVLAQTLAPVAWVIVSDGSTDRTDAIVSSFVGADSPVTLLRSERISGRTFSSKARSINTAYERIRHKPHDYVVVLDADVTFSPTYFEELFGRAGHHAKIGVFGGTLLEAHRGVNVPQKVSTRFSVSGPCQIFRTECWTAIGGYRELSAGVDAAAEYLARMQGYSVRTFASPRGIHHRVTGSEGSGRWKARVRRGHRDYHLGYLPLFFFLHAVRRGRDVPIILTSLLMMFGYLSAMVRDRSPKAPADMVSFVQSEQRSRLLGRNGE